MFINIGRKFFQVSLQSNKKLSSCLQSSHFSTTSTSNGHTADPYGTYEFEESKKNVEVSTKEWHYVERLLPNRLIPIPTCEPGIPQPSGWCYPTAKRGDYPYFAKRNNNHMLRVHVSRNPLKGVILTHIRGIEGDLFELSSELHKHILKTTDKKALNIKVLESFSKIVIMGDHANIVKDFLLERNF